MRICIIPSSPLTILPESAHKSLDIGHVQLHNPYSFDGWIQNTHNDVCALHSLPGAQINLQEIIQA